MKTLKIDIIEVFFYCFCDPIFKGKYSLIQSSMGAPIYKSATAITDRCFLIERILRPFAFISAQTRISVYSVLFRG